MHSSIPGIIVTYSFLIIGNRKGNNQATAPAQRNAKPTNNGHGTKIIVHHQKDQQFVVNISKDNPATLTLDDFRRACDNPEGVCWQWI